jgi:hypothetical protein
VSSTSRVFLVPTGSSAVRQNLPKPTIETDACSASERGNRPDGTAALQRRRCCCGSGRRYRGRAHRMNIPARAAAGQISLRPNVERLVGQYIAPERIR